MLVIMTLIKENQLSVLCQTLFLPCFEHLQLRPFHSLKPELPLNIEQWASALLYTTHT
jgi:hypothetical protein